MTHGSNPDERSGLDDLAAYWNGRERPKGGIGADDVTWEQYGRFERLRVYQYLLMHSHVDPGRLEAAGLLQQFLGLSPFPFLLKLRLARGGDPAHEADLEALRRNARCALLAIKDGELQTSPIAVRGRREEGLFAEADEPTFRAWAQKARLPVVNGFWREGNGQAPFVQVLTHRTRLLQALAALNRLCAEYSHPPGGWFVTEFVVDQGIGLGLSKSEAKLLAALLNPDDLKLGGRPPTALHQDYPHVRMPGGRNP